MPLRRSSHTLLNRTSSFLSTRSDNDNEIESDVEYSDQFDMSEVEEGSVLKKRLVRRGTNITDDRSYVEEIEESQLAISTASIPDDLEDVEEEEGDVDEEMEEEKDETSTSYSYSGASKSAMSNSIGTDADASLHQPPRTTSTTNTNTMKTKPAIATGITSTNSGKPTAVAKGKGGAAGGGVKGIIKAGPKASISPSKLSHPSLHQHPGEVGGGLLRPDDSSDSFSSSREGLGLGLDSHWRQSHHNPPQRGNNPPNRKHHATAASTDNAALGSTANSKVPLDNALLLRASIQDHLHLQGRDRGGLGLGFGSRAVSRMAASVDSPLGT